MCRPVESGFVDVRIGPPVDTFEAASVEGNAQPFGFIIMHVWLASEDSF